ncbi:hypothetical protein [Micromonospora sp. NPDC023814]|uniref:hypothetical protein n=1 Tax=Micromonospora sp. NPDC023814 TaxID=3154596 RepID=UPI0033C90BAA
MAAPTLVRAGRTPVGVGADSPVRVEVLDQKTAARMHTHGLSLRIAHTASASSVATVRVDYSGFRGAFGGDYAARLRLIRLPDCAATKEPGFAPSTDTAATRPRGKPVAVTRPPARRQLRNQSLDHQPGQPRHSTIHHDRSTNNDRTTIIDTE